MPNALGNRRLPPEISNIRERIKRRPEKPGSHSVVEPPSKEDSIEEQIVLLQKLLRATLITDKVGNIPPISPLKGQIVPLNEFIGGILGNIRNITEELQTYRDLLRLTKEDAQFTKEKKEALERVLAESINNLNNILKSIELLRSQTETKRPREKRLSVIRRFIKLFTWLKPKQNK